MLLPTEICFDGFFLYFFLETFGRTVVQGSAISELLVVLGLSSRRPGTQRELVVSSLSSGGPGGQSLCTPDDVEEFVVSSLSSGGPG